MNSVIEVKPTTDYSVIITFSDHTSALLDVKPFIKEGISTRLLNIDFFNTVKVDDFGGISWKNGFDFCPNLLREISTPLM